MYLNITRMTLLVYWSVARTPVWPISRFNEKLPFRLKLLSVLCKYKQNIWRVSKLSPFSQLLDIFGCCTSTCLGSGHLHTRNVCYHSVQNLLSSRSLSENIHTKIHRTKILLLLYMGVELGLPHQGKNTGWRLILYIFHKIGNIQIRICSNLMQQCKKME
jgi:hypothetical protein